MAAEEIARTVTAATPPAQIAVSDTGRDKSNAIRRLAIRGTIRETPRATARPR